MTQFFLVRVSKLMTSDEADIVPSWSAHISDSNITQLKLSDVVALLDAQTEGVPVTDIRPMTEDEIREWRDSPDA